MTQCEKPYKKSPGEPPFHKISATNPSPTPRCHRTAVGLPALNRHRLDLLQAPPHLLEEAPTAPVPWNRLTPSPKVRVRVPSSHAVFRWSLANKGSPMRVPMPSPLFWSYPCQEMSSVATATLAPMRTGHDVVGLCPAPAATPSG
jgi:hypothetical protein